MKNLAGLIGTVFLVIWQLPQVIAGFFVKLFTGAKYNKELSKNIDRRIFTWKLTSGISLSTYYVIVRQGADSNTVKHEKGHTIQSLILGPSYLIIIGLPSIIWAGLIHKHTSKPYYWFYTEAWADKLGGVEI